MTALDYTGDYYSERGGTYVDRAKEDEKLGIAVPSATGAIVPEGAVFAGHLGEWTGDYEHDKSDKPAFLDHGSGEALPPIVLSMRRRVSRLMVPIASRREATKEERIADAEVLVQDALFDIT